METVMMLARVTMTSATYGINIATVIIMYYVNWLELNVGNNLRLARTMNNERRKFLWSVQFVTCQVTVNWNPLQIISFTLGQIFFGGGGGSKLLLPCKMKLKDKLNQFTVICAFIILATAEPMV